MVIKRWGAQRKPSPGRGRWHGEAVTDEVEPLIFGLLRKNDSSKALFYYSYSSIIETLDLIRPAGHLRFSWYDCHWQSSLF